METVDAVLARNVKGLRNHRSLSVRDLAARLEEQGTRMLPSAISKIENNQRAVRGGELVALALALGVSPIRLLLPAESVDDVALTHSFTVHWEQAWRWAVGELPLDPGQQTAAFIKENRPFEDPATARELTTWLLARLPLPFHADVRADERRTTRGFISLGTDGRESSDG